MMDYKTLFETMGRQAKTAAFDMQKASTKMKNDVLARVADILEADMATILTANEEDMKHAAANGVPPVMMDRLQLTAERIRQIALGVRQVIDLPDPIGECMERTTRPNGIRIEKRRVPLGVIAMIYEARPNVTIDAAVLCLKTGNAVILRGGKEAMASNRALVAVLRRALKESGLPEDAVQLVEVTNREAVSDLLRQRAYIDVVIPRGGAGLIRRIVEESRIPVIETGSGVVHIYVDKEADPAKVVPIVINAKTQRPSVCNAAETLLVHREAVDTILPDVIDALIKAGVHLYGDEAIQRLTAAAMPATEESWYTEYNDLIMNCRVVDSVEEAIDHINRYGTKHSECIITENKVTADAFMRDVDASSVYVNASTRFTDGFEFGYGAEIGISTQKLHARGPMGLPALTSYKFLVYGDGQTRG